MKPSCRLLLGVGLFALAAGAVDAQPRARYVMKIGHLEAPTQPRHQGLVKVAELVKRRSNGEVEIQLYPASQLGNARQMVEGVQFGTIEATMMPAAFLGGFNPGVSILDIPYVFPTDRAKSQQLRESAFGRAILESFGSRSLVGITLWPNGRKSLTSNKPLDKLDGLRGQKFRVMDSKILIEQFAAIGASAVVINFSELYTSLQTGVIDGQENPLDTISTMKFHEVQKNLVVTEHGSMEDVFLVSPGWWQKLPQAHRHVTAGHDAGADEAERGDRLVELRVVDRPERREDSGAQAHPGTPTALSADAGSSAGTGARSSSGTSTPYSLAALRPRIFFLPSTPRRG